MTTRAERPLDRFPLVRTQSAEEMCAALERTYAKPTWQIASGASKVDVTLNYRPLKRIGLGYTKYGIDLRLAYPASDLTLQTFPLQGCGEVEVEKFFGPLDPSHGLTVSPGRSFTATLSANYEHILLVINTKDLSETAAAITGRAIGRPLEFHPTMDHAQPAAMALRNHVLFLVKMLSASALPLPDLLLAEFEQALAVMILHANRHDHSRALQRQTPELARSQLRRAEDYIEANWQQPLTLEGIVAATGVSALDLYRSFKKARGCSPMEFMARVRLGHARELLKHGNPSTTVAAVATICGFADMGRFGRDYAAAFGEWPAQTLQSSKEHGPR